MSKYSFQKVKNMTHTNRKGTHSQVFCVFGFFFNSSVKEQTILRLVQRVFRKMNINRPFKKAILSKSVHTSTG